MKKIIIGFLLMAASLLAIYGSISSWGYGLATVIACVIGAIWGIMGTIFFAIGLNDCF